jgi:hemerythrin-like domain-containing protein
MRAEHTEGRDHIQAMNSALRDATRGDSAAIEHFVEHAQAYVRLLREHIAKEDNCLFPMANAAMSFAENEAVIAAFDEVENHEAEARNHQRCLEIAEDLAKRFGVTQAAVANVRACCHHAAETLAT